MIQLQLVAISGTPGTGGIAYHTFKATYYEIEVGSRGTEIELEKGHPAAINAIAFDPVEPRFFTADQQGMVLIRDQKTGDPIARIQAHKAAITAICLSSDRTQLVTAAADRTVKVWDVQELLKGR